MFLLLPTIYLSWMLWWIPQKEWQWSHSGVPPLSILFHVLLEYWYLDHCNIPWFEVTLSLPPTLQLTAACWQLISSEQWAYTSGLLGMKGTLFLRVHSAIFFIQQPWTSICSNIPFWIFFLLWQNLFLQPLKGQLCYLSLFGGHLLLTLSWSRVFWWRNWAHSSMSTVFALQGGLQASKAG